jgi:prefoldin subunit 5
MNTNTEAASPSMLCREKYWEEKGIEDKVESCGHNIEQLHRRINELEMHLMLLSKHSHSANGEIVVPIKDKEYALARSPEWSPINRQPR